LNFIGVNNEVHFVHNCFKSNCYLKIQPGPKTAQRNSLLKCVKENTSKKIDWKLKMAQLSHAAKMDLAGKYATQVMKGLYHT
jgi:hypothetical protein